MHVGSNSETTTKNNSGGDEQQFVYGQLPSTRRHSFTSLEAYWHQYNYRSILRETRSCDIILSETMDSSWNKDSSSGGSSGLPSKPFRKTPVYMQPRDPSPKPNGDPYDFVDDDQKEDPIVVGVVGKPERYGDIVREANIKLVHRNKKRGNEKNGEGEKQKRMKHSSVPVVTSPMTMARDAQAYFEQVKKTILGEQPDREKKHSSVAKSVMEMAREASANFEQAKKKFLEEHPDLGKKHLSVPVVTSPMTMAREARAALDLVRKQADMENSTQGTSQIALPQKSPTPVPEVRPHEISAKENYLAMCREAGILPANDHPLLQKTPESLGNNQTQPTLTVTPMNALLNPAFHVRMYQQSKKNSTGRLENHGHLVPREELARTVMNAHSTFPTKDTRTRQPAATPMDAVVRYQPPVTPMMPAPPQQRPPANQELAHQQVKAHLDDWNKKFMATLPTKLSLDPFFLFRHFGANGQGNQPFQHMGQPGAFPMIPNHTQQLAIQQPNQLGMPLAIQMPNKLPVPIPVLPNNPPILNNLPIPDHRATPIHLPLPIHPIFWNHGPPHP
ncbi:hypothetical protein B9Z55_023778 [Caenorhabditis nigoni]|uniref:Uncharacterized protein n=1 Tax=Caenorhabditis nigoni TaxID=1611254 RepID=A0A2G5SR55_9PELO|nr:hypothetical protein B9Z55_023778 [Caenorhabditis nigoni]